MSMELRDEAGLRRARTLFLGAWLLLCALKLALAVRLPLFVDEAFYWQEGQHLALAFPRRRRLAELLRPHPAPDPDRRGQRLSAWLAPAAGAERGSGRADGLRL